MRKHKYVKVCPFLRDLGDSFLCVNNDKVADIIMDPLLNIEWSERLAPVASEIPGVETCLFVIEVKDDNRLFCASRQMFLSMDKRFILWEDIRDSVFLLDLTNQSDLQDSEIDFCSTCLYKVLIASSPAFQSRLSYEERIELGSEYILNKANEIYSSIIIIAEKIAKEDLSSKELCNLPSKPKITEQETSALSLLSWITENNQIDEVFATTTFEWLQKLDEWGLIIVKIAESSNDEEKIALIKESFEFAARLKDIAFEIVMKMSFIYQKDNEVELHIAQMEKIISIASIQFEDYMFICNQFLQNIMENKY
ncbi:MAG: hypothetical protein FK730_09555 [Asgard group archaeon]|nr:hypothetical protein [Asgard group archaeon]